MRKTIAASERTLPDDAVAALAARLRGEAIAPGHGGYEQARRLWNGVLDRRPAVIARVDRAEDVQEAVRFAREHGLVVTVRGGGHGVAGTALVDGGLTIDLARMKGIEVDAARRTARAEGGVTLGELDRETQAFGLATPLGVVTKTGIAGLTLSGGIGWLRRTHGLAADNLLAVEIVDAEGRLLRASAEENPDFYWAARGGGGALGAVTSFEYRLHPVGPEVQFTFVLYPGEHARSVLLAVDAFLGSASDEVSPLGILGRVPHGDDFPASAHGQPYVGLAAMYVGDADEGERVLEPLRRLAEPIVDFSGRMLYTEAQGILDEDYPDGWRYYWKSLDLEELNDDVLDRLVAAAESAPSDHSTIDVWFHGGAMSRIGPEETAFGARPRYLIGVEANWEDAPDDDANIAWAREAVAELQPFSEGGSYLNFPGFFEEGADLLRASFGERNFARLVALKERYDPAGVFGSHAGM